MKLKPLARCPPWPEQAAFMRAEECALFLREILPEAEYTIVRQAVYRWDAGRDREKNVIGQK